MLRLQAIAAQLEILAWRDSQLAAISLQLEEAFPRLRDELTAQVEQASILDLARSAVRLKSHAEQVIQRWGVAQLVTALERAESELDQRLLERSVNLNLDSTVLEQVAKALPAIAGVGLIGASLAAIPTVVSFATVSTSVLAFWGTATVSWPLVALGAAGIGVAALAGSKSLKYAHDKARAKLRSRLLRESERRGFGIGEAPHKRCMLSDIQAAVVQAGVKRIEGAT